MKLSSSLPFLLAAWGLSTFASAEEEASPSSSSTPSDDDHFGPDGLCSDTYPTLDLHKAFQPLNKPPQIRPGRDGVTRLKLPFNLVNYNGPSYSTILRAYNGFAPGPTIHVEPGGSFELELINCLHLPLGFDGEEAHNRYHHPNSTNMHTHGPHITGESPGDNVFLNIGPQESHTYTYEFDENHMPGTFWYHPHLHGSSALQVGQGAAGMIVIDHPKDYDIPDNIKNMPEIQMVFQHMGLETLRDSSRVSEDGITNWVDLNFDITNTTTDLTNFMLVNMQFIPKVTMEVGKWYRWRMVMSSMRESLSFLSQSGNCEFQLLAKDGIYLTDAPREVPTVILSPGNRADVAVKCREPGQEYMNATAINFKCEPNYGCFDPSVQPIDGPDMSDMDDVPKLVGTFADPKLQPTIMIIDVVSPSKAKSRNLRKDHPQEAELEPFSTPTPCYLVDLRSVSDTEISSTFTNSYQCENPGTDNKWPNVATDQDICGVRGPYGVGGDSSFFTPWVNSSTYINDFATGGVQEITLQGIPFHPYHQHINPYQIQKFENFRDFSIDVDSYVTEPVRTWYQDGDWHDVLQFPASNGTREAFPTMFTQAIIRFQSDQFTGHMVQHCHLLFHEDQGMMAQYDVTGEEGATWPGAREIDPTCIKPSGPKSKSGKSKSGKSMDSKSQKTSSTSDHDESFANIRFANIDSMSMSIGFLDYESMSVPIDDGLVFEGRQ